jgi:hypothetical protein
MYIHVDAVWQKFYIPTCKTETELENIVSCGKNNEVLILWQKFCGKNFVAKNL